MPLNRGPLGPYEVYNPRDLLARISVQAILEYNLGIPFNRSESYIYSGYYSDRTAMPAPIYYQDRSKQWHPLWDRLDIIEWIVGNYPAIINGPEPQRHGKPKGKWRGQFRDPLEPAYGYVMRRLDK